MLAFADMSTFDQYRPPGRSNRSGRSQADNDVFEGLPVKQWGQSYARVSLVPPVAEIAPPEDDRWGESPMPRDFQFLHPWTQQLLKVARSGKISTKRKADPETGDDDKADDEPTDETKHNSEDRGFVAKKWKPVPEALLEPEHKRFEFLAKRRRGLGNLYGVEVQSTSIVPMRKTKVLKASTEGDVTMYEVLVPEGQIIEGEVSESTEIADVKAIAAAPGTVIEGLGIANDEGVIVAEHLKPAASSRRSRPPKKKGGPGRGKKRVTFTNPDGSTYTTVVPNATKIVPQPGQTVKHVAKGEEAGDDVTAEEAAKLVPTQAELDEAGDVVDGDDGEDDDDDGEDGEDDDDREEGELSDEDAPTERATPAKLNETAAAVAIVPGIKIKSEEDTPTALAASTDITEAPLSDPMDITKPPRDASSSREMPLAGPDTSKVDPVGDVSTPATAVPGEPVVKAEQPPAAEEVKSLADAGQSTIPAEQEEPAVVKEAPAVEEKMPLAVEEEAAKEASLASPQPKLEEAAAEPGKESVKTVEESEEDLLGNFEKHLEGGS
nr:hypothetical protein CFP56_20402 [Quercus suber]